MTKKTKFLVPIEEFAKTIYDILKSDRYVLLACGGFTGEGKSTFTTQLQIAYSEIAKRPWSFNNMTWSRKELMTWIDGKGKDKKGRVKQYSAILPDELFHMFYRRKWFDNDQIDSISTFNMCRDRHLFIAGNVPDFWDLDSGFLKRVTFYAYIPERGRAWIFEQENNPFSIDSWNVNENKKIFRRTKNPYAIKNFICEIHFPDWSPDQKRDYLAIRNDKRVEALREAQKERKDQYADIKKQRDTIIDTWLEDRTQIAEAINKLSPDVQKELTAWAKRPTYETVGNVLGMSYEAIRLIRKGKL